MTTKYHYQAIIPTRPSERYQTFGVEIIVPASSYAPSRGVDWVEIGPRFPAPGPVMELTAMLAARTPARKQGWEIDSSERLGDSPDCLTYRARPSGPDANTLMQDYSKGYTVREYRRILSGQWDSALIRKHPHWNLYQADEADARVAEIVAALRRGEKPGPDIESEWPHVSLATLEAREHD